MKNDEIPENNSMEYLYEVHTDDLIVNITFAWEGALAIASKEDKGALVSHRFPTYTFKKKIAIPKFFGYMILDKVFIYRLDIISPGGAGRNRVLNKTDFLKLRVLIPKIDEQRKIADCLSSIDALIAAQIQKLDALKEHKKGLMQQLFPAEGESVPKLRFPEFSDEPEWNGKNFSEFITEMESGVSVNSYDTPVIGISDAGVLKTSCIADGVFFPDENKKIVESEVDLAKTIPKRNTILVSRMNTPLLVGESGYVCTDYPNLFLPDRLWRVSCNEGVLNTIFFSKYLASDNMRSSLRFSATGTSASMKNISKSTFLNFMLHIPSSVAEQQKIADCLSSLDDLIFTQTQKIDALKGHKKGLMQQLFPWADEARG